MFSKSKRFPSAGKDYVPGPGEYEVNGDSNRHKRYGFLSQSDRFSEEHPEDDGYSTATLSSDILPRKELPKSMLKEFDMLVSKSKRLESALETLENEKKSMQLAKDMELADVRSKNASLQKTIARQEKQIKANSWQKRVEQLEQDYEKKLSEKERQMIVLQQDLGTKTTDLEQTRHSHLHQMEQASEELRKANELIESLEKESAQRATVISHYERMHAEESAQICVQQQEIATLHDHVERNQKELEYLTDQLDSRESIIAQKSAEIEIGQSMVSALQSRFECYRKHMNLVIEQQRESKCQGHRQELSKFLKELSEAKKFINTQGVHINHLKSDIYWLTLQSEQLGQIIKDMRQDGAEQRKFYQSIYVTFPKKNMIL
ncbi:unnamed protein product [Rhizopus stolonifer]